MQTPACIGLWNLSRVMLVTYSMPWKNAKTHKRGCAHHEWIYVRRFLLQYSSCIFPPNVAVRLGSSCVRLQGIVSYIFICLKQCIHHVTSGHVTPCHATFTLHYINSLWLHIMHSVHTMHKIICTFQIYMPAILASTSVFGWNQNVFGVCNDVAHYMHLHTHIPYAFT